MACYHTSNASVTGKRIQQQIYNTLWKGRADKMKAGMKQEFMKRWRKYFIDEQLPIAFYYTDNPGRIP